MSESLLLIFINIIHIVTERSIKYTSEIPSPLGHIAYVPACGIHTVGQGLIQYEANSPSQNSTGIHCKVVCGIQHTSHGSIFI